MNHKLLFQRNTNIHKSIKFEVRLPAHTDSCDVLLTLQTELRVFYISNIDRSKAEKTQLFCNTQNLSKTKKHRTINVVFAHTLKFAQER